MVKFQLVKSVKVNDPPSGEAMAGSDQDRPAPPTPPASAAVRRSSNRAHHGPLPVFPLPQPWKRQPPVWARLWGWLIDHARRQWNRLPFASRLLLAGFAVLVAFLGFVAVCVEVARMAI